MRFVRWFGIVVVLSIGSFGCGADELMPVEASSEEMAASPDVGGFPASTRIVHLPFARGKERMCVQGVNGSWSHQGKATRYDLDFDTGNAVDEAVFAPVSGRAHVHRDASSRGFGTHVNIDLEDGTYLVLAHFKEVFIGDGDVAQGQFLGYEGCTGNCTGDHVHIGRHRGYAALQAEYGESVEAWYHVQDTGWEDWERVMHASEFACGIPDGQWYTSALPIVLSHPNGTLVQVPGSNRVYRVDDGRLRWIRGEQVFWSYGYDFASVVLISPEEFACYEHGADLQAPGMVEAAYDAEKTLWLFVGPRERADRYRVQVSAISWEDVLGSWGLAYTRTRPPPVRGATDDLFRFWSARSGHAVFRDGSVLEEELSSQRYVVSDGVAMPLRNHNVFLLLGLSEQEVRVVADEALVNVQERMGSCTFDVMCIGEEDITECGAWKAPPADGQSVSWVEDPAEAENDTHLLTIRWTTPFGNPARRIVLSGEYLFADGDFGFSWRDLVTATGGSFVEYTLGSVGSGDTFRFSVEYEMQTGHVSWSCIGPFPPGRMEGRVSAELDGQVDLPIFTARDPTTTGCGLIVEIP